MPRINVSYIHKLWVLVFFTVSLTTYGQNNEEVAPAVAVIARPLQDSILLRWGPTTPITWELANEFGYTIERVTILRDNKLLDDPEKKLITSEPVKPWPMNQWKKLVDVNDYAGVAAQALFGETFEITENMGNDMMQVVNKAKELEMRFSFALFAADQSMKVADASGLYFVDKDVSKGEKYLYRIYSMIPAQTLKVDTGFVYVGTMDYAPLPQPLDLNATLDNNQVELSWNRENFEGIYNSYNLERSANGKDFKQVNNRPIVNAFKGNEPNSRLMFRMDSLPEFNKEYHYRIKGITSFGEVGPPSDTVKVIAFQRNDFNPIIIEKENVDNQSIKITWEFNPENEKNIEGFSVMRASSPDAPYDTIAQGLIPAEREYLDESPDLANYYVVAAKDRAGNFKNSFPALAQLVDSIPPTAPSGLVGFIDTTGLVTLTWKANEEKDIWGYRVYRANFEDEEYSQLTIAPIPQSTFYDTIPLKNLTKHIYYKVLAVDQRSNGSGFSEPVKLIKPDLLPPVSPVIEYVESTSDGVKLEIVASSSSDVVDHIVYRKNANQSRWTSVAKLGTDTTKFYYFDDSLADYKQYTYTVIAIDDSGLESDPARQVEGKKIDKGIRDEIEHIYAEANRSERFISVEWKYDKRGIDKFLIYKKDSEGGFKLYKTIAGEERNFVDRSLQINTIYKYKIMAVYSSGARSSFSKEIEVNY